MVEAVQGGLKVSRVGVLGAGSWGTALAVLANRASAETTLWTRNTNVLDVIQHTRVNEIYLPEAFIDPAVHVTNILEDVSDMDMLILAIPSQHLRSVCITISDLIRTSTPLIVATKGIERGSLLFMHEVVQAILPKNPVAVLSGPNFAAEAAYGLPTATTLACDDIEMGESIAYTLGSTYFRPYLSKDMIGTQIGGALKNVVAIACGIALGRGLGENARAALITRGLAEMSRLCVTKGGDIKTLMGLSGMGDLTLTCNSTTSRNMAYGMQLARAAKADEEDGDTTHEHTQPLPERIGVVEGVVTAESVAEMARRYNVSMPICRTVHQILYEDAPIDDAIGALLSRPFSQEVLYGHL